MKSVNQRILNIEQVGKLRPAFWVGRLGAAGVMESSARSTGAATWMEAFAGRRNHLPNRKRQAVRKTFGWGRCKRWLVTPCRRNAKHARKGSFIRGRLPSCRPGNDLSLARQKRRQCTVGPTDRHHTVCAGPHLPDIDRGALPKNCNGLQWAAIEPPTTGMSSRTRCRQPPRPQNGNNWFNLSFSNAA